MNNKEVRAGIIMTYLMGVFQVLVNLLLTGTLVKFLGKAEYGLYILIGSLVAYIAIFDFGLNNTVSRYIARYRAENDKVKESNLLFIVFSFYIVISLVIILLGIVLINNLQFFIKDISEDNLDLAKTLFMMLIVNAAITLPTGSFSAILAGYELFIYSRVVSILRIVALPVIAIPLLFLGEGSVMVVAVTTALSILAGICNAIYAFYKCGIRIKLYYFDKNIAKEIITYSFFVFIGVIADQLFYNTGNIILGMTRGPESVTAFGVSMQLTQYLIAISAAFSGVYIARATSLVHKTRDKEKLTSFFTEISRFMSIILFLIFGGFVAVGREFIFFWLGESLLHVFPLALLIMLPSLWTLTRVMALSIIQAMNRHGFRSVVLLIRAVLFFAVSYFAGKLWGYWGVAVSCCVFIAVYNLILDYHYERKIGISVLAFTRGILPLAGAALISVAAVAPSYIFWGYSPVLFITRGVMYVVFFICLTYNLYMREDERVNLKLKLSRFFSAK